MARVSMLAATCVVVCLTAVAPQSQAAGGASLGGPALTAHGIVVRRSAHVPPLPATTATSFIVADATTGRILAAKNAHLRLAPASTMKVLTAITLLPRLNPNGVSHGTRVAAAADGTRVGIAPGVAYSARQLFTAMLVMSANDAAVQLADAAGGQTRTLAAMNATARRLRALDTVAKTPNGLDAPGQSSSAYDLALFFRAGLAMPSFRHYLAIRSATFPLPHGKSYRIYTHDRLLTSYAGMIGGKNGYTIAAHASFVGAATRGGHTIIVVVMRDRPNFWPETTALLNWGFAADGHASAVGYLAAPLR